MTGRQPTAMPAKRATELVSVRLQTDGAVTEFMMNSTHETTGVVERGSVKLPPDVQLPEGTTVRVSWDDVETAAEKPYDRQPLTEDDVRADLAWAVKELRAT